MSVGGSAFGAAAFGGEPDSGEAFTTHSAAADTTAVASMSASATIIRGAGLAIEADVEITASNQSLTLTTEAGMTASATIIRGAGAAITAEASIGVAGQRIFGASATISAEVDISASPGQPYISLDLAPGPEWTATTYPLSLSYTERPASVLDSICSNWISVDDLICTTDLDAAVVQELIDTSVEWLNDMTCNQYGGSCLYDLRVTTMCNHGPGACGSRCDWDRIDLTRYLPSPVTSIAEVRVNGEVVPTDEYRLDDRRWFVPIREGGLIPWPRQDMQLADGEDGTWKITAYAGQEPPRPLQLAAVELTCQLIRRWETGVCDLPDNTTSVTRDGVTISMQARQEGKIGLPTVDSVVELYGCRKKRRISDVTGRRATSLRII